VSKTTIKFGSGSNYQLFEDQLSWRHPENRTEKRPGKFEVVLEGKVDPVLLGYARSLSGEIVE
jgi:hypothetical protein